MLQYGDVPLFALGRATFTCSGSWLSLSYYSLKHTRHPEFLYFPRQAGLSSHYSIPAGATDSVLKLLLMWEGCQAEHSQTSHLRIDKFLSALGMDLLTGLGIMARHLTGDLDACPFGSVRSICNVSRYPCQIKQGYYGRGQGSMC